MKHSFVVLAYRESPHLLACLDSLENQTEPSLVILSTSTPSLFLENIAENRGLELRVRADKQRGIAHDWNFALRQPDTQYVTLAHQDDLYLPEYVEQVTRRFCEFPESLIAFTDYRECTDVGMRPLNLLLLMKKCLLFSGFGFSKRVSSTCAKRMVLSFGCPIPCPSVTYNLHRLGDFAFSSEFSINMDWAAWYTLMKKDGSFEYISEVLMHHRIHGESETSSGIGDNRRYTEDLEMFSRLWPRFIAKALSSVYALSYRSNTTS